MRPSKFTDEQILQVLRQVDAGTPAVEVCRELGITETTFYRWRHKHDAATGPRGMRELRDENERLKVMVADLLLDKQRAAERVRKK